VTLGINVVYGLLGRDVMYLWIPPSRRNMSLTSLGLVLYHEDDITLSIDIYRKETGGFTAVIIKDANLPGCYKVSTS
jgi:hypothetical protein